MSYSGLIENEIELKERILSSDKPSLIIEEDTSLKLINHSFEHITGFFGEELLGRKAPYPWWTEEALIKNCNTLAKIIDGDSGNYIELYKKKNGEQFYAEVDTQTIAADTGKKQYLIQLDAIVTLANIDKIQLGLELYTHKLIQNASYPILVINPDSTIKCVNHALEEMTGYRAHELVGTGVPYPWATSEEKAINYDILKVNDLTSRTGVWRIEKQLHSRFGKLFWIEVSGIPVMRAGKLQYYVCNWRDITEQKVLEQKIIQTGNNLDRLTIYTNSILKQEKKKLSMELHEEIGQSLALMKMYLASFEGCILPGQDNLQQRMRFMHKQIDTTLEKLKRFCAQLEPEAQNVANISLAVENSELQSFSEPEKVMSSNHTDIQRSYHEILSPREFQILCMIARGMRLTDIAKEIFLSVKTVSTYRANILSKMNFSTNAELTHYCLTNNIIEW